MSATFYTYDDIRLKLYIDIAKTGEFTKLVKIGKSGNDECLEAWEEIVKKHQTESGSQQYNAFFRLSKGYLMHLNDHATIRACLILVGLNNLFLDWEYLKILSDKGYKIDTSTPEKVLESVTLNLHRCENLITKAITKKNEIDLMLKQRESSGDGPTFEQMLANLNYALGFNVNEDLTLSRYNEYQKILKAKQKSIEQKWQK